MTNTPTYDSVMEHITNIETTVARRSRLETLIEIAHILQDELDGAIDPVEINLIRRIMEKMTDD